MYYRHYLLPLFLFIFLSVGCSQEKTETRVMVDKTCLQTNPITELITEETYKQVYDLTNKCLDEERDTRLTISSPGGDFGYSVAIFDTLKNSKGHHKLTTVAQGEVSSGAVLIFLAGHERLISCNATLFVHHPIMSMGMNRLRSEAVTLLSQGITRAKDAQMRLYREITKLPVEKLNQMLRDEVTMTAKEAVDYGFATRVVGYCTS